MDKVKPGDIWVSAGVDGSQIVYHIKKLFINTPDHHLFNGKYNRKARMVYYRVINTRGQVRNISYPLSMFLSNPTGSHGRGRKLAVRPSGVTDGLR